MVTTEKLTIEGRQPQPCLFGRPRTLPSTRMVSKLTWRPVP